MGTSTARGLDYYGTPQVQIEGLDYQKSFLSIYNNDANDNIGGLLALGRSRGTTIGSNTIVQANDALGTVVFYGSDGVNDGRGAEISAFVDGTPGAGDMPGRLVFSTTADGAASPTEQMRLDNSGNLKFNSGYGSVATAYGCRAWVNFNGTGTVAIRASGNVSSITDNGTGDYSVNFTTAMPDANYAVTWECDQVMPFVSNSNSVNSCSLQARNSSNTNVDITAGYVSIFR